MPAAHVKSFWRYAFVLVSAIFALVIMVSMFSLARASAEHTAGVVRYVALDGTCGGAEPCYAGLQAAVDASGDGDQIKVAQGIYTSNAGQVAYLSDSLALRGGYTLTNWVTPNPSLHPTIIDGENERRGVFVEQSGTLSTTVADFIVRNGFGINGGGIHILTGTVSLKDMIIITNTASMQGNGGGIYIANGDIRIDDSVIRGNERSGVYVAGGYVQIAGSTVEQNMAERGGGISVVGGVATLTGNLIQSNSATQYGGGVYIGTFVTMTNNHVVANDAGIEGAGIGAGSAASILIGNLIEENDADAYGCGFGAWGGTATLINNVIRFNDCYEGGGVESSAELVLQSNQIMTNSAYLNGGGVVVYLSAAELEKNLIQGNFIRSEGARGAGGLIVSNAGVSLESNQFLNNHGIDDGGAITTQGSGTIYGRNDVIAGNTSNMGAVFLPAGNLFAWHWTMVNNENYGIQTTEGAANLVNTIVTSHTLAGLWGANISADFSLFYENGLNCGGGTTCTNSLQGNPQFVDPQAWDYHVGVDSLAVNSGIDSGVGNDFDGEPRPICDAYDIGADEVVPSAPSAAFAAPAQAWAGNSIFFENQTTFPNTGELACASYIWDFGDGDTSTEISPTHTYADSGMFEVSLLAYNPAGESAFDDGIELYKADFTSSSPEQPGVPIVFTNTTVTSGATSYLWSFGDGTYSDQTSPTHAYVEPGGYLVILTASNAAGQGTASQMVYLDGDPPYGTIQINDGAAVTSNQNVTLNLSVVDDLSGVATMSFSHDGVNFTADEEYATTKSWQLTDGVGLKTVYARFRDWVGNVSEIAEDTILFDQTPPVGSLLINGGDAETVWPTVTLSLDASAQITGTQVVSVTLSNDGSTWTAWLPFESSKEWLLPEMDGVRTVYGRYRDSLGNISAVVSDTIELYSWAGSDFGLSINDGALYTNQVGVTLTIQAQPGTTSIQVSNDGGFSGAIWEPYSFHKPWTITQYGSYVIPRVVYIRYQDSTGNVSAIYQDDIILDVTAPEGSIEIGEIQGEATLFQETVNLTLEASDDVSGVDTMIISNYSNFLDSVWEPYATSKAWTLGSSGRVYARYRDRAGNVSVIYSAGAGGMIYLPAILSAGN